MQMFITMLTNDDGATLVEYALIIALVAGFALVSLDSLGTRVGTSTQMTNTQLQNANALIQTAP